MEHLESWMRRKNRMKEQKQKEQYPKEQYQIGAIAHIVTDFSSKFGIPRQSGLVEELEGRILFEPEYGTKEAEECIVNGFLK